MKTDREDAHNIAELLADGRLPLAYAPPLEVQILPRLDAAAQPPVAGPCPCAARREEHHEHQQPAGPRATLGCPLDRLSEGLWRLAARAARRHALATSTAAELRGGRDRACASGRSPGCWTFRDSRPWPRCCTPRRAWASSPPPRCWPRSATSRRFPDGKAIGRYAGLTPRLFASGGKERHGHISKTGPSDLRWVLQQAAWTAIRCNERIKRRWLKISRGSGKKAAAVAIARQLLVALWQMVRRKHLTGRAAEPVQEAA